MEDEGWDGRSDAALVTMMRQHHSTQALVFQNRGERLFEQSSSHFFVFALSPNDELTAKHRKNMRKTMLWSLKKSFPDAGGGLATASIKQ